MGIIADMLRANLEALQESDRRSQALIAETIERCDRLIEELEAADLED